MAIVLVCDTKDSTLISLLDATHFYIRAFEIPREHLLHGDYVEAFEDELFMLAACDCNGMFRIVRDNHRHNIFVSLDIFPCGKILKKVSVLVEFIKALDVCNVIL